MRVIVTGVHVTDPHRAHAFYTEVLGMRDVVVVPEHELFIVGPSTGWEQGCQIVLERIEDPVVQAYCERQHREGNSALMLGVPDAELEYRRLKERGDIVFHEELTKDILGLHFQIDDTVGNILSIHTA
ncbi:VOC family protein [Janibacter anophelis]|uniref:VOC family protein n=1 Tax=Janibacter anophelis TaxID=319054 RepID=UPI003F7FB6FA